MRIAIVDDEQGQRDTLKAYLTRFSAESGSQLDVDEFSSGDALLEHYRLVYDILIFDIDMPGTNGMDAARRTRELDSSVVILFVTNMAQYAINGYEVGAIDYILKPVGYFDFAMKFRRAAKRAAREQNRELLLETVEGSARVQISDILYVETMGHYLTFHRGGISECAQEIRVRGNMKEQAQQLNPYQFCQIHKSFLVNLRYVEEINGKTVTVRGETLPVGRAYKDQLMQEYLRFVRD